MLYQPTNVYPSMTGALGNGVVDANGNLTVSWQVNGNSPLTAFQIVIYDNNPTSTQRFSTGKITDGCPFYGVDYAGNVQYFSYVIPAGQLLSAGITNGNDYKLIITQWWSDSNSVSQSSASAFITRTAPTLTISALPNPVPYRMFTFYAVYTQAEGDVLNWVRWEVALKNSTSYDVLKDTGKLYGVAQLQFSYDGFFTGSTYAVRCSVQTENGVEATTGWIEFAVEYQSELLNGTLAACQSGKGSGVKLTFPSVTNIPGEASGSYTVSDSYLRLPEGSSVKWEKQDGEQMNLEAPFDAAWRGLGNANGMILQENGVAERFTFEQILNQRLTYGCYGDKFVATSGRIYYSEDGTTWTEANPPQNNGQDLLGWGEVAYGVGKYVAIKAGYSATSEDGITWTAHTLTITGELEQLCFGNNVFAAIISGEKTAVSSDGVTWEEVTVGIDTGSYITCLTFGDGVFMLATYNSGPSQNDVTSIFTSEDGKTWTKIHGFEERFQSEALCYGNGTYLMVSVHPNTEFFVSTNGTDWSNVKPQDFFPSIGEHFYVSSYSVCYGGDRFVVLYGNGSQQNYAFYSYDAKNWMAAKLDTGYSNKVFDSVFYGNGKFFISSDTGIVKTAVSVNKPISDNLGIEVSAPDLNPRIYGELPSAGEWRSVTYGNGKYVTLQYNSDSAAYSTDGKTWTAATLPVSSAWGFVIYANQTFYAFSYAGDIATSSDGTTWTSKTKIGAITDVSFIDGKFYVSNLNAWTVDVSSDLENWSTVFSGDYTAPVLGNGIYVSIPQHGDGAVVYSYDGKSWGHSATQNMIRASDITFGGTLFVAVGYSSDVMVSSDGLNWTVYKNVLGRSSESYGAHVFYSGAQFICCTGEHHIFTSTDGETWNAIPLGNACWAGCYGNGNLLLMPYGAANVYGTDSTSASMQIHAHDGVITALSLSSTQTLSVLHLNEEKKIVVSTDADELTWEQHESSVQFASSKVLYGNGLYVAFSYNQSAYSVDGINWSLGGYGSFTFYEPACFGGGKFVALSYVSPFGTHSFVSTDGKAWKDSEAVANAQPIDLFFAKNQFVGLFGMNDGGIVVAVSETGESWEIVSTMPAVDDGWRKIVYGNGVYVVIAPQATAPNGGAIAYSKDLINWTVVSVVELTPHYTVSSPVLFLYDICFSGDRFVIVGDNETRITLCSYDGITWDVYSNEHSGPNIIFAQGWFLSVYAGSAGKSKDGINWTACDSPIPASSSVNPTMVKLAFGGSFVWVDNTNAYTSSGFVSKTEIPLDFSFDSLTSLQMEGSQTCDYVLVSQNELTSTVRNNILSEPSYHPTDVSGQFFADFDTDLNGGGFGNTGFTKFAIYRYLAGSPTLTHVFDTSPEDGNVVIDCGSKNAEAYTYYAFGINGSASSAALISNQITTCIWNWSVLSCTKDANGVFHPQKIFFFGKNLSSGDISNNNTPQILQNFTQYPTVQTAPFNYKSGTLTSLIGTISDGKYSDTVNLRNEIMELSTTRNTLFLKSRKGDLLRIRISAAIEVSTMDNSPTQAQTAKISWVEVGGTDDARIVITKSDGAWPY